MSAPRHWTLTSVRRADAGPAQSAMEIRCGACGATDHIINSGDLKIAPPAIVAKKFAERGWIVGGGPSADRCPACAAAILPPKRKPPHLTVIDQKEAPVPASSPAAPDAPREMTREQRRIIFLKLEEVYLDETSGYDRGWTDKRVAEDLGVPKAWVAEIRDQNFGPARDNEDIRELLAAHDRIVKEASAIRADTDALVKRAAAISSDLAALSRTADVIRKAVAG